MVPKRHHVMKLYKKVHCTACDGKMLVPDGHPQRLAPCSICHGLDYALQEVTPADLDKMNLDAVMVLGKLKEHIARGKKNCDRANEPCVYSLYAVLENIIRDLESAADLKAVQEILVQAKAWEMFYGTNSKTKGAVDTPAAHIKRALDAVLTQARAELEAEKGDSHE